MCLEPYFQDELFLDKEGGAYFNTTGEDPSVLLRVKEDHDGAEPSGNSVSAINLIRLASIATGTKSDYYRQKAEHLLVCCRFIESNHRVSLAVRLEIRDTIIQLLVL